jgi:hypothetical protein
MMMMMMMMIIIIIICWTTKIMASINQSLIRLHTVMCQRHTVLATHSIIKCNAPKTAIWHTFFNTQFNFSVTSAAC